MYDTERLNLIEHYEWDILCYNNKAKKWMVCGKFGKTDKFKTIREAIDAALSAQMKWALS